MVSGRYRHSGAHTHVVLQKPGLIRTNNIFRIPIHGVQLEILASSLQLVRGQFELQIVKTLVLNGF